MYYTSIDKQNKILLIYLIVGRIFLKKDWESIRFTKTFVAIRFKF